MNSNNLPTLAKESIWDKIKRFFIKDKKQIETNNYIVPEEKKVTSNNINNNNSLNCLLYTSERQKELNRKLTEEEKDKILDDCYNEYRE